MCDLVCCCGNFLVNTSYMEGLIQSAANYVPLTPISFLERASLAYRDGVSIIYNSVKFSWRQTFERCLKISHALKQLKISHGDIVAALAPNVPALYELHFAVPMAGAILCPKNIHEDSTILYEKLQLLEAKVLFVDYQYIELALEALKILSNTSTHLPLLVIIPETDAENENKYDSRFPEYKDYNYLLQMGNPSDFEIVRPKNECDPISIVFTSGTTGVPKGVVHSHRGAYLNSLAGIVLNGVKTVPVFLWTHPMFHCNGCCFPWAIAALGGTNICLRTYNAKFIFDSIVRYNVTVFSGTTPLLISIVNAPPSDKVPLPSKVTILTGGAPLPPPIVLKIEELGFNLVPTYGSSEVLGPGAVHGLNNLFMEALDVKDPVTMQSVPSDGETLGELMLRGNSVTLGYYKNTKLTQEKLKGGWYHTGDVGVRHPDGTVEMKDRQVDIIICGGQQISSVDVEAVLFSHPAVFEAAVVAKPDGVLGETPCAFVMLKEEYNNVSCEEIIKFCGDRLPEYMVPKTVIFGDLPFTSTGKTQKYVLRERVKALE